MYSTLSPPPDCASPTGRRRESLAAALCSPACYPHEVDRVELIETHISWVLLAGDFAYKLKKPVRLPFLDFSTLEARRHYCEEELRLNRRTAPRIYLDVVPIGGESHAPRIGRRAPLLDYAVRMQRFPQDALLSSLAAGGRLEPAHVDALADAVASFHAAIAGAPPPPDCGSASAVAAPAEENFAQLAALPHPDHSRGLLDRMREWTLVEGHALASRFDERRAQGFVRECHGDLHLGNAILLDGTAVLFDAVEFDPRLRWTDVMSDVAFAFMDLSRYADGRLAWRFLSRYLESTGDYAGLDVLRFYCVYRAMVRAKVDCIRAGQLAPGEAREVDARRELDSHLALARRLSIRAAPLLLLMHGTSGSGKTTVAQRVTEALGAVRLRSDVERKRLHGLEALARTGSGLDAGLYTAAGDDRTYERLAALARRALQDGYRVVVDAAFLERRRRQAFRDLARQCGAAFEIFSCVAPEAVLRERLSRRDRDASEADAAVLDAQLAGEHALDLQERAHCTIVDTREPIWRRDIEAFARRYALRA